MLITLMKQQYGRRAERNPHSKVLTSAGVAVLEATPLPMGVEAVGGAMAS